MAAAGAREGMFSTNNGWEVDGPGGAMMRTADDRATVPYRLYVKRSNRVTRHRYAQSLRTHDFGGAMVEYVARKSGRNVPLVNSPGDARQLELIQNIGIGFYVALLRKARALAEPRGHFVVQEEDIADAAREFAL